MFRSWPSEWRGGLTAIASGLAFAMGLGLLHRQNPISLIFANLVPYLSGALILIALMLFLLRAPVRGTLLLGGGMVSLAMTILALAPTSLLPTGGKHDLVVISFNLLAGNTENGSRIADYFASSGADVVFTEESAPIVPYLDRLAETYPHQAGCDEVGGKCGDVLILSKYRLDNVRLFPLVPASRHQTIEADVQIGQVTVHLVAVQLLRADYGSLHLQELQRLRQLLANQAGPIVVAGDFNATPWLSQLNQLLEKANLKRATIEPATWPIGLGPLGLPIDHIFVKAPARHVSLDVLPDTFGSNHRGLMAEISLGDQS